MSIKPCWLLIVLAAIAVVAYAVTNRWDVSQADEHNSVRLDRWTGRTWILGPNASQSGVTWHPIIE